MNVATHFATGYLMARGLGYESDRFETFFLGLAAILPDFDLVAGLFPAGPSHGVLSHTIIGGALLATALAFTSYFLSRGFFRAAGISPWKLLGLSMLGLATHLILDVFTYGGGGGPNPAHRYFWPLWTLSFHMDYLWPGIQWRHRVLVEVLFSAFLAAVILVWDVLKNGNNPLYVFDPRRWWDRPGRGAADEKMPRTLFIYPALIILLGAVCLATLICKFYCVKFAN
jgi:membrane-bound metal-dependent hydrolase YbcI (DUF457 family)